MKKKKSKNEQYKYVISYLTMRRAIGILGLTLPFILVIGSTLGGFDIIQSSISEYYYTNMRNVFVGILCAMGLFLFSYRGYDRIDNLAGNIASIFILGVAFLPTEPDNQCLVRNYNQIVGHFHTASAALFFITIALISIYLFTKQGNKPTDEKLKRNNVYRICGWGIIGTLVMMAIYIGILKNSYPALHKYHPVFWLETLALILFGISWLLKGGILMRDAKENNDE